MFVYNFLPKKIFYEKEILNYELGKKLMDKYKDVEKTEIFSHNNIPQMRENKNSDFPKMKRYLILGVRKSLKYVENHKVSDYLVPYTSSGCIAMCMYCYLVCNYNKYSYLRLFVNREEMLAKLVKTSNISSRELVFEIGSNSDLVLENQITNNLEWTIEEFGKNNRGYITLPTKFDMVDSLLNLKHNGRTIIRVSVNPEYIINNVEFGTSRLKGRIEAINKLVDSGYKVGILIAPIIMVENWQNMYYDLIKYLSESLSVEAKQSVFFEIIFMTYSFVQNAINKEAFSDAITIYNKEIMRGRGRGKYMYKDIYLSSGKDYIKDIVKSFFPNNKIVYIV
jgi:spore photoproduct lyase